MTPAEGRRQLSARLRSFEIAVTAVIVALALSFWYLQVIQYAKYRELADTNHQRTLALRAPRGILFDRGGRVLVENADSYNISILREHTRDPGHTVSLLARVTGEDEASIREALGRGRSLPPYQPVPVIVNASLAQVAAVMARRLDTELPDVVVERVPTRRYPAEALAAHLFGYVGLASDVQVSRDQFKPGSIVGQSGIERIYNEFLMGRDGARRVVVNSAGREIRTIEEQPPTAGHRVKLAIDLDLQKAAEDAFKALGYAGAAVVLDPTTFEVLTFVSLPAYDPNAFATGIDRTTWTSLNTNPLRPLQNRAIQGLYSPGSTFKIAVATAALEEGIITPDFKVYCPGSATFYGRTFQCSAKGGHGTMDLRHAIERSCNVYFYTVGNMVGVDKMARWAHALGLGVRSGIDLPNEVEGLVPTTEWKKARTGERWYAGETISVAIGQGQVSVTPVSMAVMMATVANGGTRYPPRLALAESDGSGWNDVARPEALDRVPFNPTTLQAIRDGLWLVVNGNGTGGRARIAGRDVVGKTGTAQVISIEGGKRAAGRTTADLRDHGWFLFFAPRDNPEIAGAIFAEHAEHGSYAAPIARHVMETYFAKKEGRPLPVFTPPADQAARVVVAAGGQQ